MESVPTHKVESHVLICPKCEFKHHGISKGPEGWLCYQCKHDFGDNEDFIWSEIQVDAVKCEICGREVTCTPDNFNVLSSVKEVCCPACNSRTIGIYYREKWRPSTALLEHKGKEGYIPVKTEREKLALHVLNEKAKQEESSFRTVRPKDSKVLWKGGRAIGYHTFNIFGDTPCGRQIYVVPEERKQGYATFMFKEFIDDHEKIAVESPNDKMIRLLEKLGLIEIDSEGNAHLLGRITFVHSF